MYPLSLIIYVLWTGSCLRFGVNYAFRFTFRHTYTVAAHFSMSRSLERPFHESLDETRSLRLLFTRKSAKSVLVPLMQAFCLQYYIWTQYYSLP